MSADECTLCAVLVVFHCFSPLKISNTAAYSFILVIESQKVFFLNLSKPRLQLDFFISTAQKCDTSVAGHSEKPSIIGAGVLLKSLDLNGG